MFEKLVEMLGLPLIITSGILVAWIVLQAIGEIIELCGKIVPEWMKIRKFFKRKKEEKKAKDELLRKVELLLEEVNTHYSADNIAKRDAWMSWVNSRAIVYDKTVNDVLALKDAIDKNNEITVELYLNQHRRGILDFATLVSKDDAVVSRELFNRIIKEYDEYEAMLKLHNRKNGETEISMKVIRDAYEHRVKNKSFLEDIRGYNS